jgi:hypothetical protein
MEVRTVLHHQLSLVGQDLIRTEHALIIEMSHNLEVTMLEYSIIEVAPFHWEWLIKYLECVCVLEWIIQVVGFVVHQLQLRCQ